MRVSGLAPMLITVPLLALPAMGLGLQSALAGGSVAEEALRILTRAKTIDANCSFLTKAQRIELSHYEARAEVAAASESSAAAAKRAQATGRQEGAAVGCSDNAKADVRETLFAARAAIASAKRNKPEESAAAAKPNQDAKPGQQGDILARYDRVVRSYYLERQCRSLSRREDDRFWRAIVRLHKTAVARHGADKVAPVMRRAEDRANRSACGTQALAEIRRGYEETTSR